MTTDPHFRAMQAGLDALDKAMSPESLMTNTHAIPNRERAALISLAAKQEQRYQPLNPGAASLTGVARVWFPDDAQGWIVLHYTDGTMEAGPPPSRDVGVVEIIEGVQSLRKTDLGHRVHSYREVFALAGRETL